MNSTRVTLLLSSSAETNSMFSSAETNTAHVTVLPGRSKRTAHTVQRYLIVQPLKTIHILHNYSNAQSLRKHTRYDLTWRFNLSENTHVKVFFNSSPSKKSTHAAVLLNCQFLQHISHISNSQLFSLTD